VSQVPDLAVYIACTIAWLMPGMVRQ
jgi:hypothetical protein